MSPEGMSQKYQVGRIGDEVGKHDDCRYFVLDPQHDATAREALLTYATSTPDRRLSSDLIAWLDVLGYSPKVQRQEGAAEITGVSYLCRECGDPLSEHADPCPDS